MEEQKAFGNYLRAERELRQIPLAEIASATKIPLYALECIEHGDWEQLPADVFVRGFIRSYARYIGMSPEDACSRYANAQEEKRRREIVVEPVGDAASDVAGQSRFGVALFVIILLIIATITLSLIWRSGASADIQIGHQIGHTGETFTQVSLARPG
jgi:cytoskeleton protein RodZ